MTIMVKAAVPKRRLPSQTLHYTRQEVKEYIERFDIIAIEKITKVFGGLPCRTVKVFPLPDDFEPQATDEFFSSVPGDIVATLIFTENDAKAMFVSLSTVKAVLLAVKQTGQSISSPPLVSVVNVQVLSDSEFLKFLQALVLEFRFFLHGDKKRRFEQPDSRGTTLSAKLDVFLSVLRSTFQREEQKAEKEEKSKLAAAEVGLEEPDEGYRCRKHKKRNKFEIAYANKLTKEFDLADHMPPFIAQHLKRVQEERRRSMKRATCFPHLRFFTLMTVATSAVVCCLYKRMHN